MSNDDQLKQLSRRAYISYHQDGLIDIIIGLGILGFGLMIFTGNVVFNMLAWMPIIFYVPLKNRITVPRFGYVQFTPERNRRLKLLLALLVGMLFLVFVLGLVVFARFEALPSLLQPLVAGDGMLLIASLFAIPMFLAGLITHLNRLLIYALLALLILPGGAFLGVAPEPRVVFLGALILFTGLVLLVRFLRAYPLPKDESA